MNAENKERLLRDARLCVASARAANRAAIQIRRRSTGGEVSRLCIAAALRQRDGAIQDARCYLAWIAQASR